ncbi:MAG: cytochrome c3 family protein [Thermoanaerobaculia bacterium]|nr:cytochrome c3 family protein [Thermoanaerobaculia bacterium]
MKKSIVFLGFGLLISLGAVAVAHHGPEEIVIDEAVDKKSAVTFPHWVHQDAVEECTTCHHKQENLTPETADEMEVEACSSCHLDPEDEAPSMREMSIRKNPFHVGCIDCHKEQEAGPTKCADCHPSE